MTRSATDELTELCAARREASGGPTFDSVNPATEEVVATLPEAAADKLDAAGPDRADRVRGRIAQDRPGRPTADARHPGRAAPRRGTGHARLGRDGHPLSRSRRGVASSAAFLDWYAADGPRLHDRELAAVGDDLLNGPRAGRGRRRFGLVLAAPPALRAIDSC
jgi:acyl-CoA reductase-like NAD-dependent aldehyde dehydrogenase